MVVLSILHDQMLLAVLVGRDHPRLALVHSRTRARPIAFIAGDFVFRERVLADFEFPRAPEAGDKLDVVWNEKRGKC